MSLVLRAAQSRGATSTRKLRMPPAHLLPELDHSGTSASRKFTLDASASAKAAAVSLLDKPSTTQPPAPDSQAANERLWDETNLQPRLEAKPFGVPNRRQVLLVRKRLQARVELLIEVSKTEHGKFFIVVFQRFAKARRVPATGGAGPGSGTGTAGLFDDIKVKEMWQVQAIQLLKLYDNELGRFVEAAVVFNPRFERVEFGPLHKQLLEMGELSAGQLREGMQLFAEMASANQPLRPRRISMAGQKGSYLALSVAKGTTRAAGGDRRFEIKKADFWSNSYRKIPQLA